MIRLLSIGIGRGHPFYMDGIAEALRDLRSEAEFAYCDVFELARHLRWAGWRGIEAAYLRAGRNPARARLYGSARTWASGVAGSFAARLLCRDLRAWVEPEDVCVVDHPMLVQGLHGLSNLFYQHGEIGVPAQSVVSGSGRTFVPTEDAAAAFVDHGASRASIDVTGLCIEPRLCDQAATCAGSRRHRFAADAALCVAVFSSGAEPDVHVSRLVAGMRSLVNAGHRARVFARKGGRLERALEKCPGIEPTFYASRAELDAETAAAFGDFDAILSPAHERSNWALGLGLPFLIVGPDIGPFPPENRKVLCGAGVAQEIDSEEAAQRLGSDLSVWRRTGRLETMSRRGEGRRTDGFRHAARALLRTALGAAAEQP